MGRLVRHSPAAAHGVNLTRKPEEHLGGGPAAAGSMRSKGMP
jgi:hypothetical protein